MQTVQWNRRFWNERYPWTDNGDQWSEPWGGPERQWRGTIWPRIRPFLPATRCLEIASGCGRWTQFLLRCSQRLDAVDLSPRCVETCQRRFAGEPNFQCHLNDGCSLAAVPDDSIDFVYSFDSLVHAEADVIDAYLGQLRTKLVQNGVGFIHHSNIGEYSRQFWFRKIPLLRSLVKRSGLVRETVTHGRAFSMTAARFRDLAARHGLRCLSQEIIDWRCGLMIDCLSVFTRQDSAWQGSHSIWRNSQFMDEARQVRCAPDGEAWESCLRTPALGPTPVFEYARAA